MRQRKEKALTFPKVEGNFHRALSDIYTTKTEPFWKELIQSIRDKYKDSSV